MTLCFDFLGVPCEVEVADPQVVGWLQHLFWRFESEETGPAGPPRLALREEAGAFDLVVDGTTTHHDLTREEGAMRLIVALNRETVSRFQGFGVHAGVVASDSGAIIFPGGPGAGKSTLVSACAMAGFEYVTDEIALFTEDGLVRPFPKPLWLATWSRDALGIDVSKLQFHAPGLKAAVAPEDLGIDVAEGDLTLSHVILLERDAGAIDVQNAPSSEAAVGLISNTYHLQDRGAFAFTSATRAVREATVLRCALGEPHATAEVLFRAIEELDD